MLCPADYLSLPGKACHQMLCSLPLPPSSSAWAMDFNLHAFTLQTRCLYPPISMPLSSNLHAIERRFWRFCQRVGFQIVVCMMQDARLAIPRVRDEKYFEVESIFLIYIS